MNYTKNEPVKTLSNLVDMSYVLKTEQWKKNWLWWFCLECISNVWRPNTIPKPVSWKTTKFI